MTDFVNPPASDGPTLELLLAETAPLLAYARQRLNDHQEAEEAVQDCLIAAWQQRADFGNRSTLRTWLTGILRHKVLDRLRARRRRPDRENPNDRLSANSASSNSSADAGSDPCDAWFDANGSWKIDPTFAMDVLRDCPRQSSLRLELKGMLALCLAALPETLRLLFSLREVDQLDTREAALLSGVVLASAPVLLTRARQRLRDCLQRRLSSP